MLFPVAICAQAVELHLLRRLHICEMASDIIPRKDGSLRKMFGFSPGTPSTPAHSKMLSSPYITG
eukprot:15807361-Heterocapsa_arctica.AAC.1